MLEEGATEHCRLADAQTQTPPWDTIYSSSRAPNTSPLDLPYVTPEAGGEAGSPSSETLEDSNGSETSHAGADGQATILYPSEDKVVLVDDVVSFLLTKKTIDRLHRIVVASKEFKKCRSSFKDAERKAKMGQSFLDHSLHQINNPKVPEHVKTQVRQNLERRKPSILADIQRKVEIERELGIKTINLEFLREQSDETFEQVLTDVGIIEQPQNAASTLEVQSDDDVPEAVDADEELLAEIDEVEDQEPHITREGSETDNKEYDAMGSPPANQSEVDEDEDESELQIAQREHNEAFHKLKQATEEFNERDEAYRMDVERHADGKEFSREQIDLFHLQISMELTRNLKQAEADFERTRARAQDLGILAWSAASSEHQTIYDDVDDGYLESEDPANNANMAEHARAAIDTWIAEVDGIEEPAISENPAMEWEAKSVNMSDSVSVCDENPRQRRRIDQWRKQQELLRAMDFGIVE
ncbi:hypothetical protein G7Y79_00015g038650 [Physcia stellaris]|nr:hypothetical protein G7Y79_00015g038650 [Physcia stellaris]